MDLKERVAYLESVNRYRMQGLNMIRDLSGFQESINQMEDPVGIFDTCRDQVKKLIQVKTLAFFLIDDETSDFDLHSCYPDTDQEMIRSELTQFVEDATFSRAVLEKKPVTASTKDFSHHFLFHVLTTVSRVRGMCVAVLEKSPREVPEAAFELFSILMTHCANALESYDLYARLKRSNRILEKKVGELSESQASLKKEVAAHEQTLGALRQSEAQYRLLAETAREIIITLTPGGKMTYMNTSALCLGGYEKEELGDIHTLVTGLENILARPETAFGRLHTVSLITRTGDKIPLEISLNQVGSGGEEILMVGRDISEQIRAQKEKADLEERLWQARKMESIGLLAGGTAHDFNNLLNIIYNYTDLALERLDRNDPVYRYLKQVEGAANDAMALAKQLYTIGRGDNHPTHRVDLNALISGTLALLKSSLGKKLDLLPELNGEALVVMAEETRLRQVLMNLITNAAYAMESGTISVGGERIHIKEGPDQKVLGLEPGGFIRIWVKDTGPGIAPEVIPHIFEPYYSTKSDKGNAGLGLAVAHGIINNYKGAIEVESSPEKGTCFYIFLPEA